MPKPTVDNKWEPLETGQQLITTCQRCGYCCRIGQLGLHPYELWQVIKHDFIMQQGIDTVDDFCTVYGQMGVFDHIPQFFLTGVNNTELQTAVCPFLDWNATKEPQCLIYTHRFHICRTFPLTSQTIFHSDPQEPLKVQSSYYYFKPCPGNEQSNKSIDPQRLFDTEYRAQEKAFQKLIAIFDRARLFENPDVRAAWLSLWFKPAMQNIYRTEMTFQDYKQEATKLLVEIYETEANQEFPS